MTRIRVFPFLLSAIIVYAADLENKMIQSYRDPDGRTWCVGVRSGYLRLEAQYCNPRDPAQRFDLEEVLEGVGASDGEQRRWIIRPSGDDSTCVGVRSRKHRRSLRMDNCADEDDERMNQIWTFPVVDDLPNGAITILAMGASNAPTPASQSGENGTSVATTTRESKLFVTLRGSTIKEGSTAMVKSRKWAKEATAAGRKFVEKWNVVRRTYP